MYEKGVSVVRNKNKHIKTLVLAHDVSAFFVNETPYLTEIYKSQSKNRLFRVFRKLAMITNTGFESFFLGDWYKVCAGIECFIVFDTGNALYLLSILKKHFPYARIILWYWNPVEKSIPVHLIDREKYEVWSYHKNDCAKFNLNYNTQFYIFESKPVQKKKEMTLQDVYFVGADKNRSELLHEMITTFDSLNVSYKVILTPTRGSIERNVKYSTRINAQENYKNILESRAIIDVVPTEHVSGDSLRPFEAQIYHKKLITNDKNVKSLRFYSPDNIFIWGEDEVEKLPQFVKESYVACGEEFHYYEFHHWLNRFMA